MKLLCERVAQWVALPPHGSRVSSSNLGNCLCGVAHVFFLCSFGFPLCFHPLPPNNVQVGKFASVGSS